MMAISDPDFKDKLIAVIIKSLRKHQLALS